MSFSTRASLTAKSVRMWRKESPQGPGAFAGSRRLQASMRSFGVKIWELAGAVDGGEGGSVAVGTMLEEDLCRLPFFARGD